MAITYRDVYAEAEYKGVADASKLLASVDAQTIAEWRALAEKLVRENITGHGIDASHARVE